MDNLFDIAQRAESVLRKATARLAERQGTNLQTQRKELRDVVTEADLESERFLIAELSQITPGATIFAEESGLTDNDSATRWVIDPLDGTVNFASGLPWFSGTIAYQRDGETLVGLTHSPKFPLFAKYIKGAHAEIDERPVAVSGVERLDDAVVSVVITSHFNDAEVAVAARIVEALGKRARGVRTVCSGSLEMAMVACGRTSGYIGIKSDTVSHAATMPLVFAAGGMVTTEKGVRAADDDDIRIASNGRFHDDLLEIVNAALSGGK